MYQSKNFIRQTDKCYIVEGYTDVISLHQKEINNVVASSGTSLTVNQIKLIKRYTNNITILFDGDEAGLKASMRGIDMILESDSNVRVILFPKGEDPDSYSRKINSSTFKDYLSKNEIDFITFKIDLLYRFSKNDPLKKVDTIRDILISISKIPDTLKRSVYIKETSMKLEMEEDVLISELNKILLNDKNFDTKIEKNRFKNINKKLISVQNAIDLQEKECMRILVSYGTSSEINYNGVDRNSFIKYFINEIEDIKFTNLNHIQIIKCFKEEIKNNNVIDVNYFLNHDDKELFNLKDIALQYLLSFGSFGFFGSSGFFGSVIGSSIIASSSNTLLSSGFSLGSTSAVSFNSRSFSILVGSTSSGIFSKSFFSISETSTFTVQVFELS